LNHQEVKRPSPQQPKDWSPGKSWQDAFLSQSTRWIHETTRKAKERMMLDPSKGRGTFAILGEDQERKIEWSTSHQMSGSSAHCPYDVTSANFEFTITLLGRRKARCISLNSVYPLIQQVWSLVLSAFRMPGARLCE
jgi:hypothetical protein